MKLKMPPNLTRMSH